EAGKLELNPQTVQLTPLINEVIGTAGQLAEQNKNRLVVDAQESLGALTVDPMRLRQILLNLLSNVAHRIGASLSYAASAHHRRICCCQLTGHYRAPRGSSAFNPAWPAIHRRKSTRRGHQYRHRGGRECIPDGYTLLMAGASNAINATFYPHASAPQTRRSLGQAAGGRCADFYRERRDRTRPGSRAPPKRDAELRMVVTLRQAFVRVPQAIPPFFKACTHKSAFCKRGSVNVGFAPKATEPDHRRAPSIHPRHEIRVMRTERWTTVTPKRQSRDRTGPRP